MLKIDDEKQPEPQDLFFYASDWEIEKWTADFETYKEKKNIEIDEEIKQLKVERVEARDSFYVSLGRKIADKQQEKLALKHYFDRAKEIAIGELGGISFDLETLMPKIHAYDGTFEDVFWDVVDIVREKVKQQRDE